MVRWFDLSVENLRGDRAVVFSFLINSCRVNRGYTPGQIAVRHNVDLCVLSAVRRTLAVSGHLDQS